MSTAAVIAIAIGVVVVLGAVSFLTLARRSDVRGAGALSRIQSGSLHRYVLFVLAGSAALLLWSIGRV